MLIVYRDFEVDIKSSSWQTKVGFFMSIYEIFINRTILVFIL